MSCKGLKGKSLKDCKEAYKKSALEYKKSFNQPFTVKTKTTTLSSTKSKTKKGKTKTKYKSKTKSTSEIRNDVTRKRTQLVSRKTNKKPRGKKAALVTELKKDGERVVVASDGTRNSFGHRKSQRELKKFQRTYKS